MNQGYELRDHRQTWKFRSLKPIFFFEMNPERASIFLGYVYRVAARKLCSSKRDHLRMNVAPDRTIILGLQIVFDHRPLSSIGQKILMILQGLFRCLNRLCGMGWDWLDGWLSSPGRKQSKSTFAANKTSQEWGMLRPIITLSGEVTIDSWWLYKGIN